MYKKLVHHILKGCLKSEEGVFYSVCKYTQVIGYRQCTKLYILGYCYCISVPQLYLCYCTLQRETFIFYSLPRVTALSRVFEQAVWEHCTLCVLVFAPESLAPQSPTKLTICPHNREDRASVGSRDGVVVDVEEEGSLSRGPSVSIVAAVRTPAIREDSQSGVATEGPLMPAGTRSRSCHQSPWLVNVSLNSYHILGKLQEETEDLLFCIHESVRLSCAHYSVANKSCPYSECLFRKPIPQWSATSWLSYSSAALWSLDLEVYCVSKLQALEFFYLKL